MGWPNAKKFSYKFELDHSLQLAALNQSCKLAFTTNSLSCPSLFQVLSVPVSFEHAEHDVVVFFIIGSIVYLIYCNITCELS